MKGIKLGDVLHTCGGDSVYDVSNTPLVISIQMLKLARMDQENRRYKAEIDWEIISLDERIKYRELMKKIGV